ncbi:acyltransferase [Corynebacterium sp. sy017]|uniref:acyltransferase family protein n=1 Tax=unclassified Corynebacterium TaxID=2624378 RepID=UPI001184884E|nr:MULTISPECIES: acyltransferase family protein [unclassified Corynebacterium]MBP3087872.1 acyltransferase [Corynebacterium sp. sy017]TSD92413.1 acyltransferase [Corynebacterium sp. SY003]
MNPSQSSQYRYDLDGLRAIAVLLVVFYHVFVGRVSGGVDIFLLLSGFFFLSSQLRYAAKPQASLNPWFPFWRTIRRLAPSLITVLGAVYCVTALFTPQLTTLEFYRQITASLLYYQNYELINQDADYNAASPTTSALQHLWSMSVQGQFYLFSIAFALVCAAIYKTVRRKTRSEKREKAERKIQLAIVIILGLITLASFCYAARFGLYGTSENYYSFFSRLWEMTLGGVCALSISRIKPNNKVGTLLSSLGLIAIALTGVFITTTTAFPGPLSLIPLGGALLIIVGGKNNHNAISTFLSLPVFQWGAKIAYPLYLWHWPLLIICTSYSAHDSATAELSWLSKAAIIICSIVLAYLTHRFVEQFFMQKAPRALAGQKHMHRLKESVESTAGKLKALASVGFITALLALLSLQPHQEHLIEQAQNTFVIDEAHYPGALAITGAAVPNGLTYYPDPQLISEIYPEPGAQGCVTMKWEGADTTRTNKVDGAPCIYGDLDAETTIVMTGGSHAEQWMPPLHALGMQYHFKVIPLVRQGCPMTIEDDSFIDATCAQWNENVLDTIIAMDPDLVFSTSTRPEKDHKPSVDAVPDGYINFWQRLTDAGITFLGLRDNPWFYDQQGQEWDMNQCMIARKNDISECSIQRDKVYAPEDPAAAYTRLGSNMHFVDTADWFCNSSTCPPVIGNTYVYRDQNHISYAYALSTQKLLWKYLEPLLTPNTNSPTSSMRPSSTATSTPAPASTTAKKTSTSPTTTATSTKTSTSTVSSSSSQVQKK